MMRHQTHNACTSILVGKQATLDGSTLIARNEDNFVAIWPKRAQVHPADEAIDHHFVSKGNGFSLNLPAAPLHYTAMPDADPSAGPYEESGINSENVAMSATESAYTNPRVLAVDPLVPTGIAEDAMLTVVLPYVTSAREGVARLGSIVEDMGAAETNGVLFSDLDNVWYMEIVSGHHWVAQRIPDDAYAVVANQLAIEEVAFDQPSMFMTSKDIRQFVQTNRLNPDGNRFNSRHIFGTATATDQHYNTPRVWFGQRYFTPSYRQSPDSLELPFIQHADRKISVEDVSYLLGSHYNETEFDPLGTGTEGQKHLYRAIGLSRTQNAHILQLRSHVVPGLAGIIWQAIGNPAFSPFVPFYATADQISPAYEAVTLDEVNTTQAYWLFKTLDVLSETALHHNHKLVTDFNDQLQAQGRRQVLLTDQDLETAATDDFPAALTQANLAHAAAALAATNRQVGQLTIALANASALTFTMDANL